MRHCKLSNGKLSSFFGFIGGLAATPTGDSPHLSQRGDRNQPPAGKPASGWQALLRQASRTWRDDRRVVRPPGPDGAGLSRKIGANVYDPDRK